MTFVDVYQELSEKLSAIYDSREASTIARYLIEDVYKEQFWSEQSLTDEQLNTFQTILVRSLKHEPWQYIGGYADFYGLKFSVTPAVLIPRPETEELVYIALDIIQKNNISSILDIGTGSGIIPITLALKTKRNTEIFASDISEDAITIAKKNADAHKVQVKFIHHDILDRSTFPLLPRTDFVISNPPYIGRDEESDMEKNVLDHEPHIALFVQDHIMEFYEALAELVVYKRESACFLLVEIHENYADDVVQTFENYGLSDIQIYFDMQGKTRCISAKSNPLP